MPAIDPQRLLADLRALRGIGAQGRGVVRPAFSASDMEARRWLKRRYEEAGLEATIDGVGNVLGRKVLADAAASILAAANTSR
jgi:N-carbamoyl-L-amino-acid hydrolase